ncbi:hypothetical protein FGO68_gene8477 [Halteria grandinella]|uniref:Uncharacterized protein n=1 Tax=Halteria grandinella TaxID=5974 RepID=A0A8J8NM89_HALGN|nr:hypothetical protein FGO68_gene8477 [Halteria grandinella]
MVQQLITGLCTMASLLSLARLQGRCKNVQAPLHQDLSTINEGLLNPQSVPLPTLCTPTLPQSAVILSDLPSKSQRGAKGEQTREARRLRAIEEIGSLQSQARACAQYSRR